MHYQANYEEVLAQMMRQIAAGLSAREDRKNILFSMQAYAGCDFHYAVIIVWIIGAGLGIDVKQIYWTGNAGQAASSCNRAFVPDGWNQDVWRRTSKGGEDGLIGLFTSIIAFVLFFLCAGNCISDLMVQHLPRKQRSRWTKSKTLPRVRSVLCI
jgi:hypothetical protein